MTPVEDVTGGNIIGRGCPMELEIRRVATKRQNAARLSWTGSLHARPAAQGSRSLDWVIDSFPLER